MNFPLITIGIPVMPQREKYIDQCINSIVNQNYKEEIEVIVAQHPGFQYTLKLSEIPSNLIIKKIDSGKSLSKKRNDIIAKSNGDYIIFIDDDVVVESDWLIILSNEFLKNDYDIFWGPARPIYEKNFPEKLDPFEMLIGGFHYNRKGELKRKGLIGCNFGFKKKINHKRGRFIEDLGRGGLTVQDGEETLFIAEAINPKMGFIKKAVVNHYVQSERVNFCYIIKNRCSNVKARIFINYIIGGNNKDYLYSRIKDFVIALKPNKSILMSLFLQSCVLFSTIYFLVIFSNKNNIPEID